MNPSMTLTAAKGSYALLQFCWRVADWLRQHQQLFSKDFLRIWDIYIYIPWPFPPVWGVAHNTEENNKTMGISLRSSGNDEGPSRVWMALLEQQSPSSPVLHNLRRFIYAISPIAPTTRLPLYGNPVATADANQNCITIIRHSFLSLARSLASLTSIPLSLRALFTPSIPAVVEGCLKLNVFTRPDEDRTMRIKSPIIKAMARLKDWQ